MCKVGYFLSCGLGVADQWKCDNDSDDDTNDEQCLLYVDCAKHVT